jgi:hypothetical protein
MLAIAVSVIGFIVINPEASKRRFAARATPPASQSHPMRAVLAK